MYLNERNVFQHFKQLHIFLQNLYSYEAHCLRNTNKVHFMEPHYNLNLYFFEYSMTRLNIYLKKTFVSDELQFSIIHSQTIVSK